jgi:secreted Zn-dependent insulinase-like peptidase
LSDYCFLFHFIKNPSKSKRLNKIEAKKDFYHQGGGFDLISKIIKPLESLSTDELSDFLKVKLKKKSATDLFDLINAIKIGLSIKTLNNKHIFKVVLSEIQEQYNSIDKPLPKTKIVPYKSGKDTQPLSEGGPM